jgi:hypothetical protein
MIISPEEIEELMRICRGQGRDLSEAEAREVGRRIVTFIIHHEKLYGRPSDLSLLRPDVHTSR